MKLVRYKRATLYLALFFLASITMFISPVICSATSKAEPTDPTAEFIDYVGSSIRAWKNSTKGRGNQSLNLAHSFAYEAIIPRLFTDFQRLTRAQVKSKYAAQLAVISDIIETTTVDKYDLNKLILALGYSISSKQELEIVDKVISIFFYNRLTSARNLLDIIRYRLKIEQDISNSQSNAISLRPEVIDLLYLQSKAVASKLSVEEVRYVLQMAKKMSLDDQILLHCSFVMAVAGKAKIAADLVARSCLLNIENLNIIKKSQTIRLLKGRFAEYNQLISGEYLPSVKSAKYPGIDNVVIEYRFASADKGNGKSIQQREELKWIDGKYLVINSNKSIKSNKHIPAGLISRIYTLALNSEKLSDNGSWKKSSNDSRYRNPNGSSPSTASINTSLKISFKSSYDKKAITIDASGIQKYMLPFIINTEAQKSTSSSAELGKSVYLLMNWLGIKHMINADLAQLNRQLAQGIELKGDNLVIGARSQLAKFPVWQNTRIVRQQKIIQTLGSVETLDSCVCYLKQKVTGALARLVKYHFAGAKTWFGLSPSSYLAIIDDVYSRFQLILDMKIGQFEMLAPTINPFGKKLPNLLSISKTIKILADYNLSLVSLGKCLFPLIVKCKNFNFMLSAIYLPGSQQILISKFRMAFKKRKFSKLSEAIYKRLQLPEYLANEVLKIEFNNGKLLIFLDKLVLRSDIQEHINSALSDFVTDVSEQKHYRVLKVNLKGSVGRMCILVDADNSVSFR